MSRYWMRLVALLMVGVGAVVGLRAREDATDLPEDLARVPAKAQLVFTVRVADLWASDLGKDVRKAFGKDLGKMVDDFKRIVGVAPDNIERLTVCNTELHDDRTMFAIARLVAKFDAKTVLPKIIPEGKEEKVGTQAVYVGRGKAAFIADGGKTFVFGSTEGVRKLLEAKPGKPAGSLALMLGRATKHTAGVFIDPSSLAAMIDKLPASLGLAKPLILANDGVAWLDLGYESKIALKMTFKDEKAAGKGLKAIEAARALASLALSGLGESVAAKSKPLAALMSKVEKALDDGTVDHKDTAVEAAFGLKLDKAVTAGLIAEAVLKVKEAAARAVASNNLKQIGLAFHNYASANGDAFPPSAIYDKDGKALLSWRVLILPYLDQDALYKEFKLDEAWDSPHNKKLIAKIPPVYVSPVGKASAVGGTFYLSFNGKSAFFEGKRGLKFTEFTDGLSNTIMATEAPADVPWTKPDDLPFDPDGKLPKIGGLVEGGFNALWCDGSVRFISSKVNADTLKAMITRNLGEVIPLEN